MPAVQTSVMNGPCILHNLIKNSGVYNFQKCRIRVPSDLNIEQWRAYLLDYDDRMVVEFLEYGWPVNFVSDVLPVSDLRNHKGARDFGYAVDIFIESEIANERIVGPFQAPPLDNFCVSTLNTVQRQIAKNVG